MSMTDPIADLLTRIRNGNQARKERVDVPWSHAKDAITRVLIAEGFLRDATVVGEGIYLGLLASCAIVGFGLTIVIKRVAKPYVVETPDDDV